MLPARTLFMMIALAGSIASGQGQPATQPPAKAPPAEKVTIELPEIGKAAPGVLAARYRWQGASAE